MSITTLLNSGVVSFTCTTSPSDILPLTIMWSINGNTMVERDFGATVTSFTNLELGIVGGALVLSTVEQNQNASIRCLILSNDSVPILLATSDPAFLTLQCKSHDYRMARA